MKKYYEIKVLIRESRPLTWRRLRIPSGINFNELASIIEIAFEWCGYHLYEFEIGSSVQGTGKFITVPSDEDDVLEAYIGKRLDSRKEKIDEYFKHYKKIKFIYDFGDNWIHDILIEKEIEECLENPICIKGKLGAFPEDCGGVWGYNEYYSKDNEREEFDIEFINKELEGYKKFAKQLYDREMF